MKKIIFTPLIALLLSFGLSFNLTAQDLMITGVADGDLSGGLPKAIELYVVNDIADLSVYGIDIAANGNPSAGAPGYNFPADAATAGSYLYLASSTAEFNTWFGFDPDYTDGSITINGDDAVELYSGTSVIDVYGAVGTDGTGQAWEYTDGWGYRVDDALPSATFTEADWTFANGALDTYLNNASAANPFPIGTFTMGGGALALPFYEPYETWPLDNWTVEGTSADVWESNDGSTYGPSSVTEGTLAAMFNVYGASSGNTTTMTTDVIDMDGAVNPTLSFDFWMDGSADANLWLKVEMTTDGTIWNEVFYKEQDGNISDWTTENILLTGATATTQIRIIGSSDWGTYNLFVDNLAIEEITCPTPSNLALDANTATEATISWTESGTATNWNLIYGAPGFDPLTGGTIVAAGTNPYTISGLTANTDYDIYVQADCNAGDLSSLEGPISVYTGYCQPAPGSVDGNGITNVTFGQTTIVNNTTSTETNNYGDYTAMVGDGAQGTELSVDITYETGYTYATKIWVDWNNDLTFDEVTELAYTGESLGDNPTTLNASFNIPLATPMGNYRMRIGGADAADIDPCYTGTYSSFEDYTLQVTAAPACPVITGLTTAGVGSDFATIDWDALGTSEWNIKISDVSINPETEAGNIEDVTATTTKPYAITATLTPNTTYYFYVQATCGAVWSAEGMFTTACETVTSFPYFEGFENAWAPDCWSNSLWTLSTYGSPFEGDEFAYTNEAGSQLTTVGFELPAVADNMILEFFYRVESASNPQDLNVNLSTDGTNFTESVASFVGITNTDYMNVQYDLSSYAGQTIWVRFEGESGTGGWSYGALIDNVTIREINTETDFLTYSFPEQTGAADINYTAYTIDVEVGNATDLTGLVADFTLSTGATADIAGTPQVSGVTANDFSSPVTYSVTAEDGTTTQPWVVTVTEAVIYTETDIVSYTFPEATSAATIDATEKTVDIEVAWNADLTALVAEYELSYGATAAIAGTDQESGVTANDFTDPVIYTVTAEDGTTNTEWTVTVSVQDIPLGATCADPYTYGTINDPEVINNIDAASRELWYTFTIDQAYMDIQVSTCASVYDTKVYVYDACGGNELAYDDDAPTGFCDADNNQSLAEIDFLEAGTYYVLITTYSGSIDISDPTTGLYISGTTDFITPYIDNTTLTLTPGTQNVATGNDANAVMDVVYPATVSDDMPVDMMTDAMIDLSELTAGAVVELLDGGTSLGTYTVTGGETVWASDAFASVSRVAADMTGGQSLSWDIVISGLADGTYNVSATLYLGLDADLTAETNMTEAATDAMEINVAAPFIDLALLMPEGSAFVCDFTDPQNVPVEIENTGNTTIATGATITFYFDVDVDGTYEITEDLTLSEDLLPGETFSTMTTNTVDFSALGTYEWEATISYTGDTDANNNFTTGYTVHFNQEIEFIGAVNDTITIASTDWPYTIETNLNLTTDSVLVSTYEWELDGSTETNLTVNADGWYTLHVMTEYCETTDSVYVLAYNNINGVTADEFSVYPNPNNGQFMIEMNLVEKQDVMLSIFNSNGQLVREFKFDDVDTFARQIDMNNVAEGLYLIRINAGGKMFNSQVVVQ